MKYEQFKAFGRIFIKFGLVGGIGTAVNLSVYSLVLLLVLPEPVLELPSFRLFPVSESLILAVYNIAAVLAFLVAVSGNCFLNNKWTFGKRIRHEQLTLRKYFKYVAVNLGGLVVNLGILHTVVVIYGIRYNFIGQLAGIAVGMLFNFTLSYLFVFIHKKD